MSVNDENGRRKALKVLTVVGSAAFCGALAVPTAIFIAAPVKKGDDVGRRWVRTLKADALREGEPKKVAIVMDEHDAFSVQKNVELGAAWLVRRGETIVAYSVVCPHLGCSINLEAEGKGFSCPCHTSAFSPDGNRIAGPSPRDMDSLATRIEAGFVEIDFHKFRIGVPEKVEIA